MSLIHHFTTDQLRAIYQAVCVEEDSKLARRFAKFALQDGVDICNDLSLEGTTEERVARGAFDANDVRQQARALVETSLNSFVAEVNTEIDHMPVALQTKVVFSASAQIG